MSLRLTDYPAAAALAQNTKFDIALNNPVIVLPESLHTNRVIVADLGQLTIVSTPATHPVSGQGIGRA